MDKDRIVRTTIRVQAADLKKLKIKLLTIDKTFAQWLREKIKQEADMPLAHQASSQA